MVFASYATAQKNSRIRLNFVAHLIVGLVLLLVGCKSRTEDKSVTVDPYNFLPEPQWTSPIIPNGLSNHISGMGDVDGDGHPEIFFSGNQGYYWNMWPTENASELTRIGGDWLWEGCLLEYAPAEGEHHLLLFTADLTTYEAFIFDLTANKVLVKDQDLSLGCSRLSDIDNDGDLEFDHFSTLSGNLDLHAYQQLRRIGITEEIKVVVPKYNGKSLAITSNLGMSDGVHLKAYDLANNVVEPIWESEVSRISVNLDSTFAIVDTYTYGRVLAINTAPHETSPMLSNNIVVLVSLLDGDVLDRVFGPANFEAVIIDGYEYWFIPGAATDFYDLTHGRAMRREEPEVLQYKYPSCWLTVLGWDCSTLEAESDSESIEDLLLEVKGDIAVVEINRDKYDDLVLFGDGELYILEGPSFTQIFLHVLGSMPFISDMDDDGRIELYIRPEDVTEVVSVVELPGSGEIEHSSFYNWKSSKHIEGCERTRVGLPCIQSEPMVLQNDVSTDVIGTWSPYKYVHFDQTTTPTIRVAAPFDATYPNPGTYIVTEEDIFLDGEYGRSAVVQGIVIARDGVIFDWPDIAPVATYALDATNPDKLYWRRNFSWYFYSPLDDSIIDLEPMYSTPTSLSADLWLCRKGAICQ